jgi:hypothetical protein
MLRLVPVPGKEVAGNNDEDNRLQNEGRHDVRRDEKQP